MSNRSLGLMILYTISLYDVVCAKTLTVFGRFILYSMILPLTDLMILCVYDGGCLALAFELELDGGADCSFALDGTLEGARFAPFCPL
jgi:hypothetical protein